MKRSINGQAIITIARIIMMLVAVLHGQTTFKDSQNQYPRVREARQRCEPQIEKLFDNLDVAYPPHRILIRGFKQEQVLELWAQSDSSSMFTYMKTYPFTGVSGVLGPKRKQGDLQIPEGFYQIVNLNPWSEFHLSLRLNYPNRSDSILGERGNLGGRILIHGMSCTIGCIPIGNEAIEELYVIGVDTKSAGQKRIPVYLFPAVMDSSGMAGLAEYAATDTSLMNFWVNLKQGYDVFERSRQLLKFHVDRNGRYKYD
jgi:murein L,D-transpeptidase YafK